MEEIEVSDKRYEPLPPRRKTDRRKRKEVGTTVEQNVQKRIDGVRALHTLESTDGCDGEFYEYLDHTADVQCHTWGKTLEEAFGVMIPCMFNYMTDLSKVEIQPDQAVEFIVQSHDMKSLLFKYMDEFLFRFSTDGFCCKKATILEFDKKAFKLTVRGEGELWDPSKHAQGTEIKAITYSNMQIHEKEGKADLYVIVDI